jgi:hypothetical protein
LTPEQKMERVVAIAEELTVLNRVPKEAAAILDRELERLAGFHMEKCCDVRLSPDQSARHKEARALARGLFGFFEKRKTALKEEMAKLRAG